MLLKREVGACITRHWFDNEDVDAIFDLRQSGVAIAVEPVAKDNGKVVVLTGAGIPGLTGK